MTFELADTPDIGLAEFFARPIRIDSRQVNIGASLVYEFEPIVAFLANPRVINRINNYSFFHARVHVKVLVTGTAFHYGKFVMAYEPWPDYSQANLNPSGTLGLKQIMQLPYVTIDPGSSQGGELDFSILHPYNGIDLTRVASPEERAARVHIRAVNVLNAVGNTVSPITLNTYVWMTDVKLYMPTQVNSDLLVEQSGESEKLNVSRVATIVSTMATKATTVPVIGPYAKATALAADSVSEIASLFGYCRPSAEPEVTHMQNRPTSNLVNCNVRDVGTKLTIDSQAEVTIDPRVIGLPPEDEMTIVSLGKREWLLSLNPWSQAQPTEAVIFRAAVTPCHSDFTTSITVPTEIAPSFLACAPFKWWRGTTYFRVEVVASAFHRGKLRITYDPVEEFDGIQDVEDNISYHHVMDLSQSRNYEFCVGWGKRYPFLATTPIGGRSYTNLTTLPLDFSEKTANGFIRITVESPLVTTQPPSSAEGAVAVNVYFKMGDDFEVAEPDCANIVGYTPMAPAPVVVTAPQISLVEQASTDLASTPAGVSESPDADEELCLNQVEEKYDSGWLALTHFGERIVSIRQVLKRYMLHSTPVYRGLATTTRTILTQNDFPYYRGVNTLNPAAPPGGSNFNWSRVTLLNWYTPCYLARRGAIRWKAVLGSGFNPNTIAHQSFTVHRASAGGSYVRSTTAVRTGQLQEEADRINEDMRSDRGSIQVLGTLNNTLEYEVPYYSPGRFRFAQDRTLTLTNATNAWLPHNYHTVMYTRTPPQTAEPNFISMFVAAGDDFQLCFFKFTPVLRNIAIPTV